MPTLSQFLLNALDRPWIKIGPRLAPKDKTTPFSLGRWLGIALWRGSVGFLLGLVPTRLVSSLWLAWPSEVLAGLAVSHALVGFGLGAFCWNRRAARLRVNPESAVPPPLGLADRVAALPYAIFIWLLIPLALFLTFESFRGEIAWRNERARLVAAGEKLSIREILGPEIPAAENAGAAPFFAPVFDYTRSLDTNVARVFDQRVWLPSQIPSTKGKAPQTPRVNLDAWAEYYRKNVKNPQPDDPSWVAQMRLPEGTNDSSRVVLAGLDSISSGLAEIAAAARLPRSQFPIHYNQGFDALLPHLPVLKEATLALQVRCAAHLATGETNLAAEDVESALQVADILREEPFVISQLVRYAQSSIAAAALWQGLAIHAWNEPQLARWQNSLERIDFRQGFTAAIEGERICLSRTLEDLIISHDSDYLGDSIDGWSTFRAFGGTFVARSFVRRNEVVISEYSQTLISGVHRWNQATPPGSLVDLLATFKGLEENLDRQLVFTSPYTLVLRLLAPSLDNAVVKMARAEAVNRMATLACALERYRLAHGEYPESLAALSPGIIAIIPSDPVNNQPFHYTKTNDGWFLLYSLGENGIDDGGVYMQGKNFEISDWPWPVPSRPALENLF